jgi:hypothetical protein
MTSRLVDWHDERPDRIRVELFVDTAHSAMQNHAVRVFGAASLN